MHTTRVTRIRCTQAICTLLLAASFAAAANAQQTPPRDPIVRSGVTTKVSDHVFVIPDDNVGGVPNVGFIVGEKATLVVDTGLGPANGLTVLKEAQKVSGQNALYLVTTHVHPEHDLGAQSFPSTTKLIRSQAQVADIAESGKQIADVFRNRSPVMKQLLEGAVFRKADITFGKNYTLDLGGVSVKLTAVGPNHTPGDTIIFVEQDAVLFSGDVAMKGLPSFVNAGSNLAHWLSSLDQLDALKPRIVVPSHGPMGDATFMSDYRRYLTLVRDRTVALKAEGKTVEQATQTLNEELRSRYPDTARLGGAVRAAYAEAR